MSKVEVIKQVAELIRAQGMEYRDEPCKEAVELAKKNGLIICFGASDDLCELRGAEYDEVGCFNGGKFTVDADGLRRDWDEIDHEDKRECKAYFERERMPSLIIKVIWCDPEIPGCSFSYKVDAHHETFDVMEDGELYCRGIVVALPGKEGSTK